MKLVTLKQALGAELRQLPFRAPWDAPPDCGWDGCGETPASCSAAATSDGSSAEGLRAACAARIGIATAPPQWSDDWRTTETPARESSHP